MESEVVQIYLTFEQVWCVGPHTITMLLAAVNTLKGHLEVTWCITAVLRSHTLKDGIGRWIDTQIAAGWYDEDCPVL